VLRSCSAIPYWARLKEIGTCWNQWCLIFQCVRIFFKGRSFTSVFILYLLGTQFNIFEVKFNFEKWLGWGLGRGNCSLLDIMKFKNTCTSTESKTFYPHENAKRVLTKRPLPDSDVIRCIITITACVFPVGTDFVQVSPLLLKLWLVTSDYWLIHIEENLKAILHYITIVLVWLCNVNRWRV